MSALDQYTASFIDPFDVTISQPKILDGSVTRSSGMRFRQTGNITLNAAGSDNFIVIIPGFGNGMAWFKTGDTVFTPGNMFPSHLSNQTRRGEVRKVRLVSSGLKLALLNSSDDNEGYWEAVRLPVEAYNLVLEDTASPVGEDYRIKPKDGMTWADLSNYPSFQTGRLRDLHRFMFKLNSTAPDHVFEEVIALGANAAVANCYDKNFDMVVIRLVGRIDAVTPSMLQFDFVSNQEVVYRGDTIMERLATANTMVPAINVLLDRTRFMLPAIQIA